MNAIAAEIIVSEGAPMVLSPDTPPVATDRSDHDLMLAVREGEIARLGDLFERYHGQLYGFFVRVTGERTLSEDLVQLVFYRILKYRHTYRDEGKFSAWIYHLARRVVADHYRKHRAPQAAAASDAELEEVPDEGVDVRDRVAISDDLDRMKRAFSLLPSDQREILTLHRFQRLAHTEIARLLDCSVGATKVRLHRAIKSLREKYLRLGSDPSTSLHPFSP